jgi:hypothetical protein
VLFRVVTSNPSSERIDATSPCRIAFAVEVGPFSKMRIHLPGLFRSCLEISGQS